MTGAILRFGLRRWYVVLLCLALSGTVGWFCAHREGVYFARYDAVLLAPPSEFFPNRLEDPRLDMTPLAGLISAEWNGARTPLFTASGDTTLYGIGIREGVQVRIPNQGSQWNPRYLSPVINVQIVDSNPEVVRAEAARVTAELAGLLAEDQRAAGVADTARVTMITSPAEPNIEYITGRRSRALVSSFMATLIGSLVLCYRLDARWVARRAGSAGGSPTAISDA
ncbi:MAG: hypothetical protein ACK5MT_04455 [Actinomycetales bacterium]